MDKTLLLTAIGVSLLSFNVAQAVELAPYVGVKTGVSQLKNDPSGFKNQDRKVLFGSVTVGVDFQAYNPDAPYSVELEYTYRPEFKKSHTGGADIKSQNISYMLNGYYEILPQDMFRPYVSAGLGFSRNHREVILLNSGDEFRKTAYSMTWSLGAGVKISDVAYNTDAVFGYRYLDFGQIKTARATIDMNAHELYAGLNYKF